MNNLKNKLIKLGSEKPELQKHIRPVLNSFTKEASQLNAGEIENMAFKIAENHGWTFERGSEASDGRVLYFKWRGKGLVQVDVLQKGDPVLGTDHILIIMSHLPQTQSGKNVLVKKECDTKRECEKTIKEGFRKVESKTSSYNGKTSVKNNPQEVEDAFAYYGLDLDKFERNEAGGSISYISTSKTFFVKVQVGDPFVSTISLGYDKIIWSSGKKGSLKDTVSSVSKKLKDLKEELDYFKISF